MKTLSTEFAISNEKLLRKLGGVFIILKFKNTKKKCGFGSRFLFNNKYVQVI